MSSAAGLIQERQTVHADLQKSVVPNEFIHTMSLADSVEWYLLDAMTMTDLDDVNTLEGLGEILDSRMDNNRERLDALVYTLSYPQSFPNSDVVKESEFLPDVAVKFCISGEPQLIFSYSFYCNLCLFQMGDSFFETNGEEVRQTILQMAREVFPNDKYLRRLRMKL